MGDSQSPLRKRRRSGGGSLAKRIALENATVPICFADQKDKVYNLPWPDLLQENELPFQSYEDLTVGKVVLAPWKHRGSGIQFSKACVVDAGYRPQSSCASGEAPSTTAKVKSPKKRQSPRKPRNGGKGRTKRVSQDTIRQKASKVMDQSVLTLLGSKGGENASGAGRFDSTTRSGPQEGSGAGGFDSTTKSGPQEGSGAGGFDSTTRSGPQEGSGAGGFDSTTRSGPQEGSGAGGFDSTTGYEQMENGIGASYYFQTSPHSVFSRENQDIFLRRCFSQPPQQQLQMPFQLSRRYTYPPHVGGSCSETDWPPLSDDDISLFSQPSGVSSERTCTHNISSKDLSFVYNNWIAPLTEKLRDIEAQFRRISMGLCTPPSTPYSATSSVVTEQCSTSRRSSLQSVSSQPPLPRPSLSSSQLLPTSSPSSQLLPTSPPSSQLLPTSSPSSQLLPGSSQSPQLFPTSSPSSQLLRGSSHSSKILSSVTATTEEQPVGLFLGYPEKEKHRVWVQCKREDVLAAESSASDYNNLANALLDIVFEEELQTPDKYCCTSSKGKELLNEEKMRGIRIHLHRKYLNRKGFKLNSVEEKMQWKCVQKKMNNHIRYLRRRRSKGSAEADSDI